MKFVQKYKNLIYIFMCTFIIGTITHCSILWLEAIAPDALATGLYKISGNWEMSLGRWGIQFVDIIRGGIVNKEIILLFMLFFLSMASCIINQMFKIKNKFLIFLVCFLIGTAPQFSETLMFTYCTDSYALSFLLSILSAYLIINRKEKKYFLLLGILSSIFSLSIYQAYIAVTVTLILIYTIQILLKNSIDCKELIINLFKNLITVLISMIIYFIITKIILYLNDIDFSSYKGANDMSISTIIKNLPLSIPRTYSDIVKFLFGEKIIYNNYWNRNIINGGLCLLNIIIIIFSIINKNKFEFSKVCLLIFIILIMPLSINLMDIIMPNTQTNIVTGPALLLIYVYIIVILSTTESIKKTKDKKIFKYCTCALLCVLCYTYIMSDKATYMSRNDVYKNYYVIANDVLNTVNNLENYEYGMKWCFTDNIRYKSEFAKMSNGTMANDYETWDGIDGIWHNWGFYHRYLGIDLYLVDKKEYFEIVDSKEVEQMPIYPSNGSIKIIDDIVVIKISDSHYEK